MRTALWPQSWNCRTTRSGTPWPSVTSGAVGSIPSLIAQRLAGLGAALELRPQVLLAEHPLATAAEGADLFVDTGHGESLSGLGRVESIHGSLRQEVRGHHPLNAACITTGTHRLPRPLVREAEAQRQHEDRRPHPQLVHAGEQHRREHDREPRLERAGLAVRQFDRLRLRRTGGVLQRLTRSRGAGRRSQSDAPARIRIRPSKMSVWMCPRNSSSSQQRRDHHRRNDGEVFHQRAGVSAIDPEQVVGSRGVGSRPAGRRASVNAIVASTTTAAPARWPPPRRKAPREPRQIEPEPLADPRGGPARRRRAGRRTRAPGTVAFTTTSIRAGHLDRRRLVAGTARPGSTGAGRRNSDGMTTHTTSAANITPTSGIIGRPGGRAARSPAATPAATPRTKPPPTPPPPPRT